MVSRVFSDIATELCYFYFRCQLPLETAKHNLALSWFETITKIRNWTSAVSNREEDKFLVDEIDILKLEYRMINKRRDWIIWFEPFFALISQFLSKSKFNRLIIFVVVILELYLMCVNLWEIIFSLFCSRCSQTFVVLDLERLKIFTFRPIFVLRDCEETLNNLITSGDF